MQPVFEKEDYRWQLHKNPLGIPSLFFRDVKNCFQRVRKGYCDKDLWHMYNWFLKVMPDMLQEYKDNRVGSPGVLGENYTNDKGILVNDTCHDEWNEILDHMIFLLRDCDEETCSKKNQYDAEHLQMFTEFCDKYGFLGEGLMTEDELKEKEKTGNSVCHFPREVPEYQELDEKYSEEEKKLEEYRNQCKNEFFELFSQWFWYLWD
ncbi:MAG: hypothetical protein LUG57_01935 [Oscillospiraceae bacterium]|nr:hypothetical protein [Oscillospiraceae bacterium]